MAVDAVAADLAGMYRETRQRLTALVAGLDKAELGAPVLDHLVIFGPARADIIE